ncbi:DnaJ domain-containing protein [Candidatus Poribacteria bacterium]|nr:DnaJ domain-containing protein [Candidatus Poribacteria bacterium]
MIEIESRKIEAKREQIAHLCLELEEMKLDLRRFEAEYGAMIGKLLLELDRLKVKLKEYSLKIETANANPNMTEEEIDQLIEGKLKWERAKVEKQEEMLEKIKDEFEPGESDRTEREEMRRLYLKLAKKYHPDKAEDKEKSERMMAIINKAYEEGDLQLLRKLSVQVDDEIEEPSKKRRIERLREQDRRLDRVIAELKEEIERIRRSPMYRLKCQVEAAKRRGEDLFERMAEEVRGKIKTLRFRLELMSARFKSMMNLRKSLRGMMRWL